MTRLDRAGVRCGRIDVPAIWPVVLSWWRLPVSDIALEHDYREFYLSLAPAAAEPTAAIFAGTPPTAIAGIDLVSLEFGRRFVRKLDAIRSVELEGGAGVTLWYEAGPVWERLRQEEGWIEMGPSTPNIDAFADGRDLESLTDFLDGSGVLEIAARQRALALVVSGEGPEDLVVVAKDKSR